MLDIKAAASVRGRPKEHRVGLAIAGGGPIGGIYELGALRALDEALDGVDLNDLDVYVGVSSGSFLAAGLANQLSTAEMCRIFINSESLEHPFKPEMFLRPAFGEYVKRLSALPSALLGAFKSVVSNPFDVQLIEALGDLGKVIPTGVFDNARVDQFLRDIFSEPGRTNDFRELARKLYIVAVELDSGAIVKFGDKGHDRVPISKAVQASSALPGLYPPVEINQRHYVDGVLKRTLHASVALDEGVDLVLGINPLVAFDSKLRRKRGKSDNRALIEGGLPVVLSQTFRTLIQSRMQVGFGKYEKSYEQSDLVLFEPDADDAEMFFINVFSFASRKNLCEHAYRSTMRDLRERFDELDPLLKRHGMGLKREIVFDTSRGFETGIEKPKGGALALKAQLNRTLDELKRALEGETEQRKRA
jgi:NTE family protein